MQIMKRFGDIGLEKRNILMFDSGFLKKKHCGLWDTENPIQENGLEMKTRAIATYGNSV